MSITDITDKIFNEIFSKEIFRYFEYWGRSESRESFVKYEKGILMDLNSKNLETIALNTGRKQDVRNLSNLLRKNILDFDGMQSEYQNQLGKTLSCRDGMLCGDTCHFPKQGQCSVGVKRQYCGALGKIANCQCGVMVSYNSAKGRGVVSHNIYIPEDWFDDEHSELWEKCLIPEETVFRTQNDILLGMITDAVKSGFFDAKYIGVDSAFGRDAQFRDSLPEGLIYFADIPNNYLVFPKHPKMITPKYSGVGKKPTKQKPSIKPLQVKDIIKKAVRLRGWEEWVVGNGSNGPIKVTDKIIAVVECRDGMPGKEVWLYARLKDDGSIKYALCNESMDATPEMVRTPSLMRWSIELCFKDLKNELGMDQYQFRSFPGWMRHILFCEIAHLFLTKLRINFSEVSTIPEPAPVVLSPVTIDEYLDASNDFFNNKPIQNPKISAFLKEPRSILSIGLIRQMIQQFLHKSKNIIDNVMFRAQQNYSAFKSGCKKFFKCNVKCQI
jgi:SRSO17 transposase